MKTSLYNTILNNSNQISFHTPAHGGVSPCDNIFSLDITELTYSDNLLAPSAVICESQHAVSCVYGAECTSYITAGATAAIHVAVRSLRKKTFAVLGASHKSVFNALRLNNATAYYADNLSVLRSSKFLPEVVIVTSPNYFGMVADLASIKEFCIKINAILIVDASHGAHFIFSSELPVSATEYGDIVIHSCHKTLAVPTGSALLHYKKILSCDIMLALNEIHSTSPSYLMMALMEKEIAFLAENGESVYRNIISALDVFKKTLPPSFTIAPTADVTRLVISSIYNAKDIASQLEAAHIFAEMTLNNLLVFIVTRINYVSLAALAKALAAIDFTHCSIYKESDSVAARTALTKLSFSDSYACVPLCDAVGKISYREVGLYPPGTPIVLSGEIFTEKTILFLKNNINSVFGLDNGMAIVVK